MYSGWVAGAIRAWLNWIRMSCQAASISGNVPSPFGAAAPQTMRIRIAMRCVSMYSDARPRSRNQTRK